MSHKTYTFCDMNNGYMTLIKEKISHAEPGTIFLYSDFSSIADSATIRQNINRLVKTNVLQKIKNGIFHKPQYSKLLNEQLPPNPEKIAHAIARHYHWTIAHDGDYALNILGLSTQVPSGWTFISDGPYKEYNFDNFKITFKHRTNKDISGLSNITSMTIQALKTLGKEFVDTNTIQKLSNILKSEDKECILVEAKESSEWIYKTIQKICKE